MGIRLSCLTKGQSKAYDTPTLALGHTLQTFLLNAIGPWRCGRLMENGSVVELTNASPDIMERAKVTLSVPISHAGYQMVKPDLVKV